MKFNTTQEKPSFQPVTVSMTFETEEELNSFRTLFGAFTSSHIKNLFDTATCTYPKSNIDTAYRTTLDLYGVIRKLS